MSGDGQPWTARTMTAAGTLLAVAVAGRLAWEILSPLAAPLLVITVVCVALTRLWRQRL